MSGISDFTRNLSLRLSKVLDEIGVNERILIKRRRHGLIFQEVFRIAPQLLSEDMNVYHFGSGVEGTTTPGLSSDDDVLFTIPGYKVIQDLSEWEPVKRNLLMIQDDTVSPGYCLLQILRQDVPLPEQNVYDPFWYRDRIGRILLKNAKVNVFVDAEYVRHGPALSMDDIPGILGHDLVLAIPCQQWPLQARQWLFQQVEGQWPTNDMKQYCKDTGCFVVGVGGKGSVNEELEWRLSTSLAERILMFNLNITQIRCFVVMKMILKTFITTQCPNSISSFMCKTVLFHCISSTDYNAWNENTFLICLNYCLTILYNCVLNDYCPHFIMPENNIMLRRFSPVTKQVILDRLYYIISSYGSALLEIECDKLGFRIGNTFLRLLEIVPEHTFYDLSGHMVKQSAIIFNNLPTLLLIGTKPNHIRIVLEALYKYQMKVAHDMNQGQNELACSAIANFRSMLVGSILSSFDIQYERHVCREATIYLQTLYKYLMKLTHVMNQGQNKLACGAIAKFISMHLGSTLASIDIQCERDVCRESTVFMSLGLNYDVASGKLKLASIFYCTGDFERTELLLKKSAESYDLNVVEPICSCYSFQKSKRKRAFNKICYEADDEYTLLQSITASCVTFLRCEINCCPKELQHEMFRSSQQDIPYRDRYDEWMDLAVVDSLPYLYFLQYKTYSHLRRNRDKQAAISFLAKCIVKEPNFGHIETALNLLGQCMEQENKLYAALECYLLSLKIRGRNNSAKFHICRLISSMLGPGLH